MLVEVFCDLVKIFEGQFAFVELAVAENIINEPVHEPLYPCGSRLGKASAGSFNDVRQHHQSGLFGLRLRPGIAVVVNVNRRERSRLGALQFFACFNCLVVKE